MSQTTVIKRQCDQCQRLTEDVEGSTPPDWFHLSGEVTLQRDAGAVSKDGEFDFCSRWCVTNFLEMMEDEPPPSAQAEPPVPLAAPVSTETADDDIPF